ncbi:hypothetical protein ACFLVZ_01985 [Chloroflexota bacterium]
MKDVGVGFLKRWSMWLAVRLAGWFVWTFNINGRFGKQADEDKAEVDRKAKEKNLKPKNKQPGFSI